MTSVTPAERILLDLGISDPMEIDLDVIAWTRGAVVNYRPLDYCEATIVGSKRKAVIAVNSRSQPERRRFSLAHELGHWHHHRGQILFCGDRDVGNFANHALNPERQADAFASDLILPNYLVEPRLRKMQRPTLAGARELANEFSASLTATLFKMTLSNRFPMVIVCHNKTRRRWFERAPMIQPWWFPSDALDRHSFAADMLYTGASEQNFPRKTGADAWFDFRNSDRFEVQEQSFLLPDMRFLPFLRCRKRRSAELAGCGSSSADRKS
jgi:Zn-dependent peptidase ImmA (M78 family)